MMLMMRDGILVNMVAEFMLVLRMKAIIVLQTNPDLSSAFSYIVPRKGYISHAIHHLPTSLTVFFFEFCNYHIFISILSHVITIFMQS